MTSLILRITLVVKKKKKKITQDLDAGKSREEH